MQYDKEFLLELDKNKNKTIYAKITALNFDEFPIETIEGRVTQGSVNIDGTSAVRRTCSLTLVAQDLDYREYYWGLNTKFKLEIGLLNNVDSNYPNIIWFNKGIYLITNFSVSQSNTNFSISISGKDKMCLLNGEINGNLTAATDFGAIEEYINETDYIIKKIPIKQIIRNMIHVYAGEPFHKIIINDLNILGLELLEYRYDTPMYLYRFIDNVLFDNITLDGNKACSVEGKPEITRLADLTSNELEMLVEETLGTRNPTVVNIEDKQCYVAKVEYGQTAGYRETELVYAGELIGQVGDTITSVLDKIVNMLGEYEYFYNLDGQFVFQRKKSFTNTYWSPIVEQKGEDNYIDEEYIESLLLASSSTYTFSGGELITSFSNNPNLIDLKNDYSIWGERETTDGGKVDIHMRYAIDTKPQYYKNFEGIIFSTQPLKINEEVKIVDWREIIYQMALDYFQHNEEDDFELDLRDNNLDYYPTGRTGYEQYYTDMEAFWRQLYDPNPPEDLKEEYYKTEEQYPYWNIKVYQSPELLNFWIDFLDRGGELQQFNVQNIGTRTKVVSDNDIKSIYFRETPEVIFQGIEGEQSQSGYRYINIPKDYINTMFSVSSQGKSAKDKLDELLYKHGYCAESVNISAIPIYYLEPNTRIYLFDEKTGLNGDYIMSRISIPLSYNGTMSITATKAQDRII